MFDDLLAFFAGRVGRMQDVARRAAPGPALVRVAVVLLAITAVLLAFPADVVLQPAGVLLVLVIGVLPGAFPRTRLISMAIFACVFGWLLGTIGFGEPITVLRLIGLSTVLYLLHSLAALAAVLPYDAVMSNGALVGWLLRATAIVSVSAIFSVLALAATRLVAGPTFLVASLIGVVVAGALAWLIARRA